MRKQLFDFLYFTKSERNGTLLLCLLILVVLLVPAIHRLLFTPPASPVIMSSPTTAKSAGNQTNDPRLDNKHDTLEREIVYFDFDPNTATKSALEQLGLSARISQTIVNYRNKGGRFFRPDDLKKIYGLDETTFLRIRDYIKINSTSSQTQQASRLTSHTGVKNNPVRRTTPPPTPLQPDPFNPNTANQEQLKNMGLPAKVIRNLISYREKGGRFYEKESLKKIYGVTPALYDSLAPFIRIQNRSQVVTPVPIEIDINRATVEEWEKLPGIGPYYANRIVKFREALGGFYSSAQLAETYGLADSTFQLILPYLKCTPSPNTIDINQASFNELKAHPYLKYKEAKAIVNYRKQHGPYTSLRALTKLPAISPETIKKVSPYLSVN